LRKYDGLDATEAFYALHSDDAIRRLKKMRSVESKTEPAPQVPKEDQEFAKFREQLRRDGWFTRNPLREAYIFLLVVSMVVVGTMLAWSHPLLAIVLIGVGMQQAGWLGHDLNHARNTSYVKYVSFIIDGWINAFDPQWWSDKHNTHHVATNHPSMDPDINNQPYLFNWPPPKSIDSHLRRYQHYYFLPLYTLLYVSWRIQSFTWALKHGHYQRLIFAMLPSYIWLALLPLTVSIGSLLLSGFLVAVVVTLSHESEDMMFERENSYVKMQFRGTRDVVCPDPITEFLFGGMQYQLEHHMFPSLPRYYSSYVAPLLQQYAREHGLHYKSDGIVTMYKAHYNTLKANALVAAREQ